LLGDARVTQTKNAFRQRYVTTRNMIIHDEFR
jgi:hypothetical protein